MHKTKLRNIYFILEKKNGKKAVKKRYENGSTAAGLR